MSEPPRPPPEDYADLDAAVRDTAYFLWEQDGRPEGRADHYWMKALEQHLRARAYSVWLEKGGPDSEPS